MVSFDDNEFVWPSIVVDFHDGCLFPSVVVFEMLVRLVEFGQAFLKQQCVLCDGLDEAGVVDGCCDVGCSVFASVCHGSVLYFQVGMCGVIGGNQSQVVCVVGLCWVDPPGIFGVFFVVVWQDALNHGISIVDSAIWAVGLSAHLLNNGVGCELVVVEVAASVVDDFANEFGFEFDDLVWRAAVVSHENILLSGKGFVQQNVSRVQVVVCVLASQLKKNKVDLIHEVVKIVLDSIKVVVCQGAERNRVVEGFNQNRNELRVFA